MSVKRRSFADSLSICRLDILDQTTQHGLRNMKADMVAVTVGKIEHVADGTDTKDPVEIDNVLPAQTYQEGSLAAVLTDGVLHLPKPVWHKEVGS